MSNGTATNVLVSSYGSNNSLFPGVSGQNSEVFSRVMLPINAALRASVYNLPANPLQAGDVVNFSIARSALGSTTINCYGLEAEYDYKNGIPQ